MSRRLHLCADTEASFSYIADWVKRTTAYRSEKLTAVLLPHQEVAIRLRKILATRGGSFINIHFWTPENLRSALLQLESRSAKYLLDLTIASREELHLVLSSVAGTLYLAEGRAAEAPCLLARAVEANPASLLRVLDLLDGAGLHARMFESLAETANFAEAFYGALEKQGLRTVSAADRLLASREWVTQFESLLIFGFHAGHWSLFPLLSAVCRSTEKLEILLDAPRDVSFELDSAWVGTWEEVLRVEALPLEGEEKKPSSLEFLAEESTHDLARALALRAAKMIVEGAESIAVVFSRYGALSREVALALTELQIPYFDAIGHTFSESLESPLWQSWCAFQKVRTVRMFSNFLTLLPDHANSLRLLQEASRETLSQDIRICIEFVRIHNGEGEDARRLASYALLPEQGSFGEFCGIVDCEFSRMGWWKQVKCLRVRQERFHQPAVLLVKRDVFLRWLQTALRSDHRQRDPMGFHPYATIQLLRRDQAALCPWTHVILAGMNSGEWPEPIEESGFLPADAIADFNRQISSTNRKIQTQGTFGEGHFAVTHIPCLGPHERNILQRRDFQSLRHTSHLVATTCLKSDADPAVSARPSLWFSELFHELHGKPPLLADLRAAVSPRQPRDSIPADVGEVSAARNVRLNPNLPFGPWEFSSPTGSPSSLAVVDVEQIMREPAIVWMKIFLGVAPPEKNTLPWMATAGIWTHRWLRSMCGAGWQALADAASRKASILSASEVSRSAMQQACHTLGRSIPPWWTFLWQQARSHAIQFSDQLEAFRSQFSFATTEYSFHDVNVTPRCDKFFLSGRWDLLLCNKIAQGNETKPFTGSSLLVVDYKTGKDLNISSILRDGAGIQLALYSHAALAWGAERVDSTWMSSHTSGGLVHLPFEALKQLEPILWALSNIIRRGTFGIRGELRSEFAFRLPMPLATLPIPQDVLESKWRLTHDFGGQ